MLCFFVAVSEKSDVSQKHNLDEHRHCTITENNGEIKKSGVLYRGQHVNCGRFLPFRRLSRVLLPHTTCCQLNMTLFCR